MSLISPNALEPGSQRSYCERSASKEKIVSMEPLMRMVKCKSGIPLPLSDLVQARGAENSCFLHFTRQSRKTLDAPHLKKQGKREQRPGEIPEDDMVTIAS